MYTTKGEFLQDLADYNELEEQIIKYEKKIKKIEYLLYDKVKSPLDYDIIGYDENKEAIRELKLRGVYNQDRINDDRDAMQQYLELLYSELAPRKMRVVKADEMLKEISDPLKSMLFDKYIKKKTFRYLDNHYCVNSFRYMHRLLDEYFETTI